MAGSVCSRYETFQEIGVKDCRLCRNKGRANRVESRKDKRSTAEPSPAFIACDYI